MKNEDAIAEFLLKEVETKESLKKRIEETAVEYYAGRYLFGTIGALVVISVLAYIFITRDFPIWGVVALAMSGTALMESKRNSGRVDAMVKLAGLTRSEPVAGVNSVTSLRDSTP